MMDWFSPYLKGKFFLQRPTASFTAESTVQKDNAVPAQNTGTARPVNLSSTEQPRGRSVFRISCRGTFRI